MERIVTTDNLNESLLYSLHKQTGQSPTTATREFEICGHQINSDFQVYQDYFSDISEYVMIDPEVLEIYNSSINTARCSDIPVSDSPFYRFFIVPSDPNLLSHGFHTTDSKLSDRISLELHKIFSMIEPTNLTDTLLDSVEELLVRLELNNSMPSRVTGVDEDGICLVFRNENKTMFLEIHSDGELGALVENHKEGKIIALKEFDSVEEAFNSVISFFKNAIPT